MAETSTVGSLARERDWAGRAGRLVARGGGGRGGASGSARPARVWSERDVVLVLDAGRDRLRIGWRVAAVAVAVGAGRAAEELDAVGDDVDALTARAVLRFPFVPVQAAVDGDRAALGQEAVAVLAQRAPD